MNPSDLGSPMGSLDSINLGSGMSRSVTFDGFCPFLVDEFIGFPPARFSSKIGENNVAECQVI